MFFICMYRRTRVYLGGSGGGEGRYGYGYYFGVMGIRHRAQGECSMGTLERNAVEC